MKAFCKRHRFFDERISFPTGHGDPQSSSYRAERKASMCCELEGVDAVDNRRRDAFPTRRANPKVAAGLVEKAAFMTGGNDYKVMFEGRRVGRIREATERFGFE